MHILANLNEMDWGAVALWGGLTVLSVIALFVAIYFVRRMLRDPNQNRTDIFDLAELQTMLDRGDISEPEFKALRARAIEVLMTQTSPRKDR
ncbi:MAG: hypothetical protein GXP29_13325 [Planctomycetes bacterium]|nr:hypothetical protein [Planctomycetota bacterium]